MTNITKLRNVIELSNAELLSIRGTTTQDKKLATALQSLVDLAEHTLQLEQYKTDLEQGIISWQTAYKTLEAEVTSLKLIVKVKNA